MSIPVYTLRHPEKLMLVTCNGKGRPEVEFGLARARKEPHSGACRCPSTRNGPYPRCRSWLVRAVHAAWPHSERHRRSRICAFMMV